MYYKNSKCLKRSTRTCGNGVIHQSFISGCVLGCVFCFGPVIKKKKGSHWGTQVLSPINPHSILTLKSLGISALPRFLLRKAAAPAADAPGAPVTALCAGGGGHPASWLHTRLTSGGSRGTREGHPRAGGQRRPLPHPGSRA